MKRKILTKVMAIGVASLMVISLGACGGKTTDKSAESGKKVSSQKTGDKKKISIMIPDFTGNALNVAGSDKVLKMVKDYTGIDVDFRFEAQDTYEQKFGLTLMDKDNMPMVIRCRAEMTSTIVDAAKKGAFWDLSEFIKDKEKFPNLSQSDPEIMKNFMVDGKLIGAYVSKIVGRNGFSYRKDWADKLGLSEPKTYEDVYNMFHAFTYDDPDGNGKDDTYGFEMTKYTGPFDIMQTWFGCGQDWIEKGGKLVPVIRTDEYRDALKWFRKCYKDGLMRKDWATVDSSTFGQGVQKGEAGCIIDTMGGGKRAWDYFEDNGIKSVADPSKNASMVLEGPINGKTMATEGHGGAFLITKAGAKTKQDVINCLTYLDKMCDNKMQILANYGLEGVDYKIENNEIVSIPKDSSEGSSLGLNQSLCFIPVDFVTDPPMHQTETDKAQTEAYARNTKAAVNNPAAGYLAASTSNGEYSADILQIIDDARTQYICGQIDEKGLDAALKQWQDRGGKEITEEINKMYQADK